MKSAAITRPASIVELLIMMSAALNMITVDLYTAMLQLNTVQQILLFT